MGSSSIGRSVESGLLTLVLRGKDSALGTAGYALEIEDLVSLHITGDSIYTSVMSSLNAGAGFQVSVPVCTLPSPP